MVFGTCEAVVLEHLKELAYTISPYSLNYQALSLLLLSPTPLYIAIDSHHCISPYCIRSYSLVSVYMVIGHISI